MLTAKFHFVFLAFAGLATFQLVTGAHFNSNSDETPPVLSPAALSLGCRVMAVDHCIPGLGYDATSMVLNRNMLGGRRLADIAKVRNILKNVGLTVATVGSVCLAVVHIANLGNNHHYNQLMMTTFFTGFSLWAISKTMSKWAAIFKPICKNAAKDEGVVDADNQQEMAGKNNE